MIAISHLTEIPRCLKNYSFPIVTLDQIAQDNPRIPYVINDEYQAAFDATELLIKRGCRHIIALIPGRNNKPNLPRSSGFQAALNSCHLHEADNENLYPIDLSDRSRDDSETLVLHLLETGKKIDGIFCGSDRIALGACHAIKQFGLKIPDDIKIIGFDNSLYSLTKSNFFQIQKNRHRRFSV